MSSILPKNELNNVNFFPSLVLGQKYFVRFLVELKKTKSPFEINWPLDIWTGPNIMGINIIYNWMMQLFKKFDPIVKCITGFKIRKHGWMDRTMSVFYVNSYFLGSCIPLLSRHFTMCSNLLWNLIWISILIFMRVKPNDCR